MNVLNSMIRCKDRVDIIHQRKGRVIYDSRKKSFFRKWFGRLSRLKLIHFVSFSGDKHVVIIFSGKKTIIREVVPKNIISKN